MPRDGVTGRIVLGVSAASAVLAAVAAAATRRRDKTSPEKKLAPKLQRKNSGIVDELESFSHYVARQLGLEESKYPRLRKVANDYLKKTKECEENIFALFAGSPDAETLHVEFLDELDRCILGYFAFHWEHATLMIRQVLAAESEQKEKKLKNAVLEATRKMRFERVSRDLKITRVFSTLTEEMKAIGLDSRCTQVMVPAAPSERSPVLLFMGGGMGAGKSTVLKEILKEPFWAGGAGANAVVVEADAFKESDVIYRALSSRGHHHDMLQTAELVHQSSTDAASSLLVTALNEGRDVIMDGTLSWEPFVNQTIAMARDVHRRRYRMGTGYVVHDDGSVSENYWELLSADDETEQSSVPVRKPYRIELVGVVCDAYLAVVRGIRRAIITKRAVRVNSQLKSHRRFAAAFPKYCELVDNARLYCTDAMAAPPKLIGWKDGGSGLLVDPELISCLRAVASLNEDADGVYELYPALRAAPAAFGAAVRAPARGAAQARLRAAVQTAEESPRSL
ncbi:calmodulin calcium-dependent NAD kinase-like [Wolffia australiana]